MPLAWSFPFIVAGLYLQAGRIMRVIIGIAAVLLAIINIATAFTVMNYWSDESFDGYFTNVEPALQYLRENGINHCYSSYFDVYAINYLTDEKIVCSQPLNERFYGWPLPYKDLVDASTNVAYVLGPSQRFMKGHFERDLEIMNITSRITVCGKFDVHTDFKPSKPLHEQRVPAEDLHFAASQNPDEADALNDGDRLSRWESYHAQEKGMWIDIHLDTPQPLQRLSFHYDSYAHDNAFAINILSKTDDGSWETVTNAVPYALYPFEMKNNHPVYGSQFQTISFKPVTTDTLRIEIETPKEGNDWTIGEIEVYRRN
jgi:hypothetical protein